MKLRIKIEFTGFDKEWLDWYLGREMMPDGPKQCLEKLRNGEREASFS